MVTRWGLIVEEHTYSGQLWFARVLGQVDGTRAEALAELEKLARAHRPRHPMSVRETQLYRHGDGFLMFNQGSTRLFHCRFSLAELLYDSEAPPTPDSPPPPQDAVPPRDAIPPGHEPER